MSSLLQHAPSDEQLTASIAAGDHGAFDELYRRYANPLAAYGARVLRDRSRGEDVAQTALARAYEALQRGTAPLRVKPWLYKIALNAALEQRAKNGEVLDGESDAHEDGAHEASSQRADILAAVQVLPPRQRMVFFLREVQGLTVGEVARRLDLDNQQVEQALFAARNRLAEELVFGTRVDCDLVRSLEPASLTRFERRALKGHLRSCSSCRRNAGFGLPSIALWFRDAFQWLAGAGSVSASKLGIIAATAAAVGTTPLTAPALAHTLMPDHHRRPTTAAAEARPTSLTRSRALAGFFALLVPSSFPPLGPGTLTARLVPPALLPDSSASLPAGSSTELSTPAAAPVDAAPADLQPADRAPADAAPIDSTPTDTTPTDTTPADTTPTDTTPTDSTPTDTTAADPASQPVDLMAVAPAPADSSAPPDAAPLDTTPASP